MNKLKEFVDKVNNNQKNFLVLEKNSHSTGEIKNNSRYCVVYNRENDEFVYQMS